jgi:hypothetical protein
MSQQKVISSGRCRWLLLAVLGVGLLFLLPRFAGAFDLPLIDFVEYWAAGRLNVHGENPYDAKRMEELEFAAGRAEDVILMWNPPWALPLVMPLGLLDCRTAHLLWLALLLGVVAWCADALWRMYGGPVEQRRLAWLLSFTFLPTLFALKTGQIAPLLLLGLVLFMACVRQGRDFLAGAALLLLALKPHLLYLFWIALLFWCAAERRWKILGGGLTATAVALALALACNPAVLGQYLHTLTHRPPAQYRSPTLGMALRLLLGEEQFRLQFLALVPGLLWLPFYWRRHRRAWDWNEHLPMLAFVSLLTAAYGAWLFDLVLLLPPLLQVVATHCRADRRTSWLAAATVYLAFNLVAVLQLSRAAEYFEFLWMTPALLLAYVALRPRRAISML